MFLRSSENMFKDFLQTEETFSDHFRFRRIRLSFLSGRCLCTTKRSRMAPSKPKKVKPKNKQKQIQASTGTTSKDSKPPRVRLVGGRIYDSENGKSCHQCRQKTIDFAASCKNKSENKQCTFHFCHKCLLNRYGEKAEEVIELDTWKCPKCRGICNCSICMKKRGHRPTGNLVHTAKATGFSSVSEMLHVKGINNFGFEEMSGDKGDSSKKPTSSNEEPTIVSTRKFRKVADKSNSELQPKPLKSNAKDKENENSKKRRSRRNHVVSSTGKGNEDGAEIKEERSPKKFQVSKEVIKKERKVYTRSEGGRLIKMSSDIAAPAKTSGKSINRKEKETEVPIRIHADNSIEKHWAVIEAYKHKKSAVKIQGKCSVVEILPPQGVKLKNIAAMDIPNEDVGHALQFLEFCEAFGQVLDLKKGQSESFLRELADGKNKRRVHDSPIVRFHIRLLSMILKDSGKECSSLDHATDGNSWFLALWKLISESQCPSKELLLDFVGINDDGYNKLDSSKKLRILNFLCDEALGTTNLRDWIDEQNSKFVKRKKKEKREVFAAKEKEKSMTRKLQDEVARATLAKNGAPLSISEHTDLVSKIKTEVAQTLELNNMAPKKKQRSDVVRSEPILLDGKGRIFWRLAGYSGKKEILLQEVGSWDSVGSKERWFAYDTEQKATIEKYILSLRS